MKFILRNVKKFTTGYVILVLLITFLRTIAYYTFFDREIGYFPAGILSSLLYILPILISIGAAWVAYCLSPAPKDTSKQPLPISSMQETRTHIHIACEWFCVAIFIIIAIFDGIYAAKNLDWLYTVRAAVALLGIGSFCIAKSGILKILSSFSPIIWLLACVCMDYFDWDVPLNSPLKNYSQIALLCCALYLIYRLRVLLGTNALRRQNMLAAPAAVFGISYGISGILALPIDIHTTSAISGYFLSLAIGLHAALCFICALRNSKDNSIA